MVRIYLFCRRPCTVLFAAADPPAGDAALAPG
jgi:hypothetical protein